MRFASSDVAVWARDYAFAARMHARTALRSRPPSLATAHDARVHIVLVQSVFERWHFMQPLGRHLERAGLGVRFVPDLGRNTVPVDEAAELVGRVVDELLRADSRARVVIVGHSKGGLIGKRVMLERVGLPLSQQPAGLVALATPFAGSRRATLWPTAAIREFAPGSRTLSALAAERAVDERIRLVLPHIDPHIPGNEVPEGMAGVRLKAAGHFRPLATREAAEVVLAFVRELASSD